MKGTQEKGITLIALVVTIIVLIILAGVSISLVLGDNGIITKARDAARETEEASLNEEVATNELMEQWDILAGGSSTPLEGITASNIEADASYIGKYVNYGGQETFKGVKWRIFNAENGQIQLISDDYIKSEEMPTSTDIYRGRVDYGGSDYCVSAKNRIILLNYINTTDNWNEFVAIKGAIVAGGPTIEQFKNSYNRTHGANSEQAIKEIFIAKSEIMADGLEGYYVGTSENPDTSYINNLNKTEMENLYVTDASYPSAYWLGSPSVSEVSNVMGVYCYGIISSSFSLYDSIGLRPLVLLPKGITLVEQENGTYNIQ